MEGEGLPILDEGSSIDTWAAIYKKSVQAREDADEARKNLKKGAVVVDIDLGGVEKMESLIVREDLPPKEVLKHFIALSKKPGGDGNVPSLFVVVDAEGNIFYCLDESGREEKFKGHSFPLTEDEFWLLEYKLAYHGVD